MRLLLQHDLSPSTSIHLDSWCADNNNSNNNNNNKSVSFRLGMICHKASHAIKICLTCLVGMLH